MAGAAAYDEIAEWYDEQVRGGGLLHDLVLPALFELAGDVAGQRVCDLACGQGVVARQLAARGAVVTGVDLSARLLAAEISSVETHRLPLAVFRVSRELEYGLTFYRNQPAMRYELGQIPSEEHLVVAPENWQPEVTREVAQKGASRRVSFLGHYAPQHVDYFWVSAAGAMTH